MTYLRIALVTALAAMGPQSCYLPGVPASIPHRVLDTDLDGACGVLQFVLDDNSSKDSVTLQLHFTNSHIILTSN